MSVPEGEAEGLEYLFRKAQRNDGFCKWKEVKQEKKNEKNTNIIR